MTLCMNKNLHSSCISTRFFSRINNCLVKNFVYVLFLAVAFFFAAVNSAFAEGSINLYLVSLGGAVVGDRAKLWSSIEKFPLYPLANLGVHYDCGAAGEKIAMAVVQ